jgi:Tol biopolymer transport system component
MKRTMSLLATATLLLTSLALIAAPARGTTPGRNGLIVFAADLGLGAEIFTIRPDGTDLHQLTELDGNATHPDWSPDGTRIAFLLEEQAIYVMNGDGSDLHQVAAPGGHPSFTPDGEHLVYECSQNCDGGSDGIFLMRDDGSDAPGVRLSTNPFVDNGDSDPQVSPDGGTVTFVRHQEEGQLQGLFAVGIDGTNERMLVPYGREVAIKHDWSPNGDGIVLTLWADFPDHRLPTVATVAPDGSDLSRLTAPREGQATFAGSYSPDGKWIVFRYQNADTGTYRLMRMRPDGSDRSVIATFPFSPRFIDWGSKAS